LRWTVRLPGVEHLPLVGIYELAREDLVTETIEYDPFTAFPRLIAFETIIFSVDTVKELLFPHPLICMDGRWEALQYVTVILTACLEIRRHGADVNIHSGGQFEKYGR
jgi:hypothetical protein